MVEGAYPEPLPPEYDDYIRLHFTWDDKCISNYLKLSEDGRICTSTTSSYSFKTAIGNAALDTGFKYYFEIKMNKGSNFKVGIAKKNIDFNYSFSDSEKGWSYYSSGYLRHNSGGSGPSYGQSFKEKDIIGVFVNLVEGSMFFSKNGKVFGTAYKTNEFLEMELYPAACCLSKDEEFELIMPQPED